MLKIQGIYCEHQKNPATVETDQPGFSWILESDHANVYQKAWRIQVWENGSNGKELAWDSQKRESGRTIENLYEGKSLKKGCEYCYQVTVWDNYGEIALDDGGRFFTALGSWNAQWIEPSEPLIQLEETPLKEVQRIWGEILQKIMRGEPAELLLDDQMMGKQKTEPYDPAVRFRYYFSVKKAVKRARAYVTAHGIYTVKINGKNLTDTFLNPGFSTYEKRIRYQIFDAASVIGNGENEILAEVADGWYKGKIALGHGCEYGEVPGFLMQIEIEYQDGTTEQIGTDGSWEYTFDGPVREADLFKGEIFDARKCTDMSDPEWKPVRRADFVKQRLEAQCYPGVNVFQKIPAKRIIMTPKGETVVDFGQNLAGFIRVELSGLQKGEMISFEHGEVLDQDGNFYYVFSEDATRPQRDLFISAGKERERFEPVYTYHGFRYVRVTGGTDWKASQFTAMAISSDNEVTGEFHCSDERLNQLQSNIYWSQRSNNITIPTDCPTREKAGWTGDVLVYGETALYNQDMTAFYRDWLKSVRAEQLPDGKVQNTVPLIKNYVQQVGGASIGWGDVILTLPWQLYSLAGDTGVLQENYAAMGKWMRCIRSMAAELPAQADKLPERKRENQAYLINTGFHFGDWLVPSIKNKDGFADGAASSFMTMTTVCTALLAHSADLYARIAGILGDAAEEKEYKQYAERVRIAFEEELCDETGNLYQELQGNYVLALQMKMVSEHKCVRMAERLNQMIKEADYRLDTGFMSVPYLLDVLYDYGYTATAWKVLTQESCPGWMYEILHGATTLWESWNAIREDGKVGRDSFNHYAFGCVGSFLYRRILGINNAGVGYDRIRLTPDYECGLDYAEGGFRSAHGTIKIRWEKKNGMVKISGKIPANTTAVLVLKNGQEKKLGNGLFEWNI